METQATKQQYIMRVWPRALRRETSSKNALLKELSALREKVSAAWKPGPSAVDEIRWHRRRTGLSLLSSGDE